MPASSETIAEIDRILAAAARYLPAQGPIDVFIHHNTLHAFEDEPFEKAVIDAAAMFGTEPFLSEARYRAELARGRIRVNDIEAVLDADGQDRAGTMVAGGRVSLRDLHRALLVHAVRQETDAAVRWTLTESNVVERLRDDLPPETRWKLLSDGDDGTPSTPHDGLLRDVDDEAARRTSFDRAASLRHRDRERRVSSDLWHACVEAVALARPTITYPRPPVRHRDLIVAVDPVLDTDALVHPLVIRLCAAFLDQGVATWPMPRRDRGLLAAVVGLYGRRTGPTEPWNVGLPAALRGIVGHGAHEVVIGELDRLGLPPSAWEEAIFSSLLALRGWAGMMHQFEVRPDRAPVQAVPARLVDFLAVRLVCDRVAAEWAVRRIGLGPDRQTRAGQGLADAWTELRDRHPSRRGPGSLARAFLLHQVAQLVGLTGRDIRRLDENELLRFERAITSFDALTRRRLFHLAYERRHRIEVLDALAAHEPAAPTSDPRPSAAQFIMCIDDRCESFRRHLEELGEGYETFGTAGFFAVPMYYRGLDDWHAAPLCPIVVRPRHTVLELPEDHALARHEWRRRLRRRYGQLSGTLSAGSRTLFRGLFTALGGAVAAVPLVARVAFPRLAARLGRTAAELARRRVPTRLDLLHHEGPGLIEGTQAGFTVPEMAAIVRRVLEDIGLTGRFSRIVAVIGHGSSSRNNPHESAYDCGACGGGRGGPNARAFAMMANDPLVRVHLAREGLVIPDDTRFVGGMLDTCSDAVAWYDADLVPESHRHDLAGLREACAAVGAADAHERCRRFQGASLDITPAAALAHVESRSVDLAQVRPELGHATNAVCIIGRRWRTRGLFLDRRAFLVSYDPTADADGAILARTLAAVGPVGAGINLEYFFSTVDRLGYGSGTKLPHNITGLIGVMDGHASDLRTGLPWQMVEIHEPVRLLVVIDAAVTSILRAAEAVPAVKRMAANRWIQLAAWEPDGGGLAIFDGARFVPHAPERHDLPVVDHSFSWYAGRRDHLPPARILAATGRRRPVGKGAST
jgi:uncharacterized protein YbcC (UPF0753/DUF2309 family)